MNRYKFRVWKDGNMYYNCRIGGKTEEVFTSNGIYLGKIKDLDIMQVVFQDKNGKDIYENDIIKLRFKIRDVSQNILEMLPDEWKRWKYILFIVKRIPDCFLQDEFYTREKNLEVIGNIYENKDLIKQINRLLKNN